MFTEARKIHLIEEVIKLNSESTLKDLEMVLAKSVKPGNKIKSAHEFSGKWNKKDAELIEKAIKEGCEQINQDDWK